MCNGYAAMLCLDPQPFATESLMSQGSMVPLHGKLEKRRYLTWQILGEERDSEIAIASHVFFLMLTVFPTIHYLKTCFGMRSSVFTRSKTTTFGEDQVILFSFKARNAEGTTCRRGDGERWRSNCSCLQDIKMLRSPSEGEQNLRKPQLSQE